VLLADYKDGMTAEEIARQLDTLSLSAVHGAVAYYHRHRVEVDAAQAGGDLPGV
jgi:uncharacterized protein (DUF433 family)